MARLPARSSGRNMTVIDPSREFEDIYDRMGQLVNVALGDLGTAWLAELPWSPSAEVSETDNAYVVAVELPGVHKDQISVELRDREVIITGEATGQVKGRRHRSSRRTGRFEYRATLPGDVNAEGVIARLGDGVLTVTVPKSEAARPREIEVSDN
jgi:HSP20 family protein